MIDTGIDTIFTTDNPADAEFFQLLKRTIQGDSRIMRDGDREIRTNHFWFRDHIHEMKGYRWWEKDITSFVDRMIELQRPKGFFFEIMSRTSDPHLTYGKPEFRYYDGSSEVGFVRLEVEADIEYLVVEAAHHIWQATGDDTEMARRLPALERGIRYMLSDPDRWDTEHRLVKRTFTIDTWDFTWGIDTSNRTIEPGMPMCIMHGDNSGVYQACLQLAKMREALGDESEAAKWRETARGIRERSNRLLWNGRFYTHQYHLDPVDTGIDESNMLSLSNTYDINRGLPTHEMAVSIIDEYRERRRRNPDDVAEWYALDPPYPDFSGYEPGEYINGGIGGFVAGELAKAAFRHGREEYGADILRRFMEFTDRVGKVPFLAFRDGTDFTKFGGAGGPRGWAAATVLSAIMEGLAGMTDLSTQFRDVEIAPRYTAAGIKSAYARLKYGPSDAWVATDYRHDQSERTIEVCLTGLPQTARFHVLLPEGSDPSSARVDGEPVEFDASIVEQSAYCDFTIERESDRESRVSVEYR